MSLWEPPHLPSKSNPFHVANTYQVVESKSRLEVEITVPGQDPFHDLQAVTVIRLGIVVAIQIVLKGQQSRR